MKHARPDYERFQDPAGKIPADEPVMLFRAQDKHFIPLLSLYAGRLMADPDTDEDIIAAVWRHIDLAKAWQLENGCKTPDLP